MNGTWYFQPVNLGGLYNQIGQDVNDVIRLGLWGDNHPAGGASLQPANGTHTRGQDVTENVPFALDMVVNGEPETSGQPVPLPPAGMAGAMLLGMMALRRNNR